MATEVGSIFVSLGLDTSDLEKSVDQATSKVQSMGQKMESVGKNLTLGLSAPIAAAGGASVKAAGDFESSFSKIEGLVGVGEEQVASFKDEVLSLSSDVGQSPQELADAMFQITSAGLEGEQAMNALEASAKAGAAGLGDTKTVADAATSAMNAYGQDTLGAAEATDVLTAAVREGKVEPTELAGSLGKVIPTASALGVEFEEVGGAIAAMTRQGANARRATTALNSLLTQTQEPSTKAKKALNQMGISAEQLRSTISEDGLLPALEMLKSSAGGNTQQMAALFGNVRAMRAAMQLAGESSDQTRQIMDELQGATGSTDRAFQEAKSTFNFQFKQLRTSLEKLRIQLGNNLLPVAQKLTGWAREALDEFNSLSEGTRANVVAAGALAAAIGPLLIVSGKLLTLLSSLGTALTALASTTGVVIGVIGALAGSAALVYKNWSGITDFFSRVWDNLRMMFEAGMTLLINPFLIAYNDITASTRQFVADTLGLIRSLLNSLPDEVVPDGWAKSLGNASAGMEGLAKDASRQGTQLKSEFDQAGQDIKEGLVTGLQQANEAQQSTADELTNTWNSAIETVKEKWGEFSSFFKGGVGGGESGAESSEAETKAEGSESSEEVQQDTASQAAMDTKKQFSKELPQQIQKALAKMRLFGKVGQKVTSTVRRGFGTIANGVGRSVAGLLEGKSAMKTFKQSAMQALKQIISQLTTMVTKLLVIKPLMSALSIGGTGGLGLVGGLVGGGGLPSLDSQGLIRESGIAKVHKGEAVVKREMMQGARPKGNSGRAGPARLEGGDVVIPGTLIDQARQQGSKDRTRTGRRT